MKNRDYILRQLEGLEQRNRDRDLKRRLQFAETMERKRMGTAKSHDRYIRTIDVFVPKKQA